MDRVAARRLRGLSAAGISARGVAVIIVWACLSWPIWSNAFVSTSTRVLDLFPFVVNCLGLVSGSYESRSLDWRIWCVNLMSAGVISLASSLTYHRNVLPGEFAIIGIATAASTLGGFAGMHADKLIENFDRRVTALKVGALVVATGLVGWGLVEWEGWSLLSVAIQALQGSAVIMASLASLGFVRDRKKVGVGSPLLWLGLRFAFGAGARHFWVWIGVCVIWYVFINLFHNRANFFDSLINHWKAWQSIESSNASVSLTAALALLLLVINGATVSTSSDTMLVPVVDGTLQYENCSYVYLPVIIVPRLEEEALRIRTESALSFDAQEHFMYEAFAAVTIVALILISAAGNFVAHLRDDGAAQGMWMPILFFSLSVMILIFPRSLAENVAIRRGHLVTHWHDDSIMAASLSMVMALLTFLYGSFRYSYLRDEVERERTVFSRVKATRPFSAGHSVGMILMFFVAVLCFCQYFELWPRERYAHTAFRTSIRGTTLEERAFSLLREDDIERLSALGLNTTDLIENVHVCDLNVTGGFRSLLVRAGSGQWDYALDIGLSDLLADEILSLGVLSVVAIALSIGGALHPVLDDAGLVLSAASSIVMIVAILYRWVEMRTQLERGSLEWFIPVVSALSALQLLLMVFLRVDQRLFTWSTYGDVYGDFLLSDATTVEEFLEGKLGFSVPAELLREWQSVGELRGLRALIKDYRRQKMEAEEKGGSPSDTALAG